MLIFVTPPTRSILTTLPSAGGTIKERTCGIVRGGVRKKKAKKIFKASRNRPGTSHESQNDAAVRIIRGMRNRKASRAIMKGWQCRLRRSGKEGPTRVPLPGQA